MARRAQRREMTIEQFDAWADATARVRDMSAVYAEEGGPLVSLVPTKVSLPVEPTPDEVAAPRSVPTGPVAVDFDPQPSRRTGGWSADRQRHFIAALAETGSVHVSAKSAGLSPRSAYGLRVRSPAFANAWDTAQQLAVGRLSALAFDRAIHGRIEQVYQEGELVAEKRYPSDKLLMWLLARLDPKRFAAPWEVKDSAADPQAQAQHAFPNLLEALTDVAAD